MPPDASEMNEPDVGHDMPGATPCIICGNTRRHVSPGFDECTHCGLQVAVTAALPDVARDICERLQSGVIDPLRGTGWRATPAALRNIAWRFGFLVDSAGGRWTTRPVMPVPYDVTLGIIARTESSDVAFDLAERFAPQFIECCMMFDGDSVPMIGSRTGIRVAAHPLDGDFGTQRNRLQAMARSRWMLQIDTDETIDDALISALGWVTAAAERAGIHSLGLPRKTWVDGRLSALYPDIQYRLNRTFVRYAGIVHERPQGESGAASLALVGHILHRMTAGRARSRSVLYEGMATGAGRPEDEDALLRPMAE